MPAGGLKEGNQARCSTAGPSLHYTTQHILLMALQEEFKQQGDFLFKHRSYLPLVLLAVGLCVTFYQQRFSGLAHESLIAEMLEGGALAVGLLGLFIRIFTVGYTPEKTSGRNTNAGQVAEVLNTTGIYSLIRNPLYLGNYLMWLSVTMLTGNIWFVLLFSLTFWLYYERIIWAEEAFLRQKFGTAYLNWAKVTPPFWPRHTGYTKPNIAFSWKKVVRQEKDGILALFLAFCIFCLVADFAEGEFSLVEETLSITAAAAAILFYAAAKVLKKYTHVLQEAGR